MHNVAMTYALLDGLGEFRADVRCKTARLCDHYGTSN